MFTASMSTYMMYKGKNRAASILGGISALILTYVFYVGDMNLIQFVVAVLPSFLATIPLYLSLFIHKNRMIYLADVLYHQLAMIFFSICILYILFFWIERIKYKKQKKAKKERSKQFTKL